MPGKNCLGAVGECLARTNAFALISPSLYAPLLRVKCEDAGRSGFSKVASILKTAAVAAGVGLADSGIEFLYPNGAWRGQSTLYCLRENGQSAERWLIL